MKTQNVMRPPPMLGMIALVPGFRDSFVESVLFYARQSSLNAPLPVPWPWSVDLAGMRSGQAASELAVGLCFLLLPVFYGVAAVVALRTKAGDLRGRALFLSALALGGAYAHHASVRSDVSHLAQCIHPLLLGCVAIPTLIPATRERARRLSSIATVVLLAALSAITIAPHQPYGEEVAARLAARPFVPYDARGDIVWINRGKAERLSRITAAVRAHVKPEEKLWISPTLLTLYPLLGRSSPVWDIYPTWKASGDEEARMRSELAEVEWVLWTDQPADDDDVVQLSTSHPDVWKQLLLDFERLSTPELPATVHLLRRKRG